MRVVFYLFWCVGGGCYLSILVYWGGGGCYLIFWCVGGVIYLFWCVGVLVIYFGVLGGGGYLFLFVSWRVVIYFFWCVGMGHKCVDMYTWIYLEKNIALIWPLVCPGWSFVFAMVMLSCQCKYWGHGVQGVTWGQRYSGVYSNVVLAMLFIFLKQGWKYPCKS